MDIYLDPRQAAAYCSISVSWLAKLRCHGGGCPYLKVGKSVRYRKADLDEWLNSHLHRNTSEYSVQYELGEQE